MIAFMAERSSAGRRASDCIEPEAEQPRNRDDMLRSFTAPVTHVSASDGKSPVPCP
jgi:hypothetical protein